MKIKNINLLLLSIFAVFVVRFLLSFLPSFGFDMGSWLGWASRLSALGFSKFYSDISWTQYTPGYLYWLWLIGKLGWINEFAIKVPVIVADIAVGVLIWSLVRKVNQKLALASFFIYTLNPVVIFDGSVWGQIDGLLTLFLYLSAVFLIEKKNFALSVLFWSIAFLIKPQSIAVLPAILIAVILRKFKFKQVLFGGAVGALAIFGLSWPFFTNNPILGLPQQILKMGNFYSYTSVNAFNIWSWVGLWKADSTIFAGLTFSVWGAIFLVSSIAFALYLFRNKLDSKASYYLLFAILSLCFFVFPTKVHERYLFPFFAFLLTSASLFKSYNLFYIYGITTLSSFINLYYPYAYYNDNFLKSEILYKISGGLSKLIGFIFAAAYFALLFWKKLPKLNFKKLPARNPDVYKLPKVSLTSKTSNVILAGILIFAFTSRVLFLSNPQKEYFDEVYHAFTAKTMLHDGPKAWEWWNTPPEGFAYEWTHPPFAKEVMVVGMVIFGENSFGYRAPAALLGTGVVLLVYLIAKQLLKDELLALFSAAVISLDGLTLVMSRIGMNDIYFLFFALLAFYLFLKEKYFFSALALGFAAASKWTVFWTIPILGVAFLALRKKFKFSLLWFLIIPVAVYLVSYIPMFLYKEHTIETFIEVQKQMWWYHTNLKATHGYSSPWYTWPFLIRPVWQYTSGQVNNMVANIYAMGNPAVFWLGLVSVAVATFYAARERNRRLGIIIFSYLAFFVPWAASPRIMFMYHYLPSIPFLAIATGYVLRRFPKTIVYFLVPSALLFIYFYPHWTGIKVPVWLDNSYYWLDSWK